MTNFKIRNDKISTNNYCLFNMKSVTLYNQGSKHLKMIHELCTRTHTV